MAILFSQVNIADAADLNPSGTNTSQVALSDETNMSNDEASTESSVSDEINGTTESESSISEETNENSKNNESESSGGNVKAESTDNIDAYYKDSKICIYNYEQLKQIGSDAYVYTGDKDGKIGSGDARNPNLRYRGKQVKTRKMTNRNRSVEMLNRNQQIT